MNLDSAPTGQPVTLDRPDLTTSKSRRLAELGLRGGSTVTPLHRTAGGGRVIGVGAARVAVARTVLARLALHRPDDAADHPAGHSLPEPGVLSGSADAPRVDAAGPAVHDAPAPGSHTRSGCCGSATGTGGADATGAGGADATRTGGVDAIGTGGVDAIGTTGVDATRIGGAGTIGAGGAGVPGTPCAGGGAGAQDGPCDDRRGVGLDAAPGVPTVGARSAPPTLRGCHTDGGGSLPAGAPIVALVGNPNVGKSTLFNALTGARRQVGNWPGTTVGVGQGTWRLAGAGAERGAGPGLALVDLPGTYSLDPVSPDEELTRALLVDAPPAERPDCVVVAVSAADAGRGLYLLSQVLEHGLRAVVALTMSDVAARRGLGVSPGVLGDALGVPVVVLDPRRRSGVDGLAPAVLAALAAPAPQPLRYQPDPASPAHDPGEVDELALADARFTWVAAAVDAATHRTGPQRRTWSDRIDRVVTSPVVGPVLFLAVMWAVFQATTVGAAPLVDGLDRLFAGPVSDGVGWLIGAVGLGGTWVEGLAVDGLVAGVGMVLTFVPLMTIMFVLLALLEDSGYLARAAVVADRLMRMVGLPGRAFVPLIIGFGCNVPAVSATRVLPDARHRLLTALVVPFTTCSARLPVYVLVGAAIFGENAGNVVFAMYVASVVLVVVGGLLLRVTVLRGVRQEPLVLDLPGYQVPMPRMLATATWSKLAAFLRTATGIIVVTVAAVWLLSAVPARPGVGGFGSVPVADSAFAAVSSVAAPVFAPAGFGDWHTAGALVVGFVAKEAVISSWAQTYAADEPENLRRPGRLGAVVRADFEHSSGGHADLAGLAFMLFVLGYAPCVATATAQVREIGLRWTLTGLGMSLSVSWLVAVTVFQVGRVFL